MENLQEKIDRVVRERIDLVPANPDWIKMFESEKNHLLGCLPAEIIRRIEHFGSTAIPNIMAKPVIDILVEVTSLTATKKQIVPVLVNQGYDYFWRPVWSEEKPPFYAWFIKRNSAGIRTHHIHMVEYDFELWDSLLFRDYLIEHLQLTKEYEVLKLQLYREFPNNRVAYTKGKTDFITRVTQKAKRYYGLE